jgi:hypothetical protein
MRIHNLDTDANYESHFRDIEVEWIEQRRGRSVANPNGVWRWPRRSGMAPTRRWPSHGTRLVPHPGFCPRGRGEFGRESSDQDP